MSDLVPPAGGGQHRACTASVMAPGSCPVRAIWLSLVIAAAAQSADPPPADIQLPPDGLPPHLEILVGLITAWVPQGFARPLRSADRNRASSRDLSAQSHPVGAASDRSDDEGV